MSLSFGVCVVCLFVFSSFFFFLNLVPTSSSSCSFAQPTGALVQAAQLSLSMMKLTKRRPLVERACKTVMGSLVSLNSQASNFSPSSLPLPRALVLSEVIVSCVCV